MARSVQEIAQDFRAAVTVISSANSAMARAMGGVDVSPHPAVTVDLPNGRTIELGALADELLEAAASLR